MEERGMVMAVLDRSFDVLILKLGVVKRSTLRYKLSTDLFTTKDS